MLPWDPPNHQLEFLRSFPEVLDAVLGEEMTKTIWSVAWPGSSMAYPATRKGHEKHTGVLLVVLK